MKKVFCNAKIILDFGEMRCVILVLPLQSLQPILPENLQFELVEPVCLLHEGEVRVIGKTLSLPDNMVFRRPFPGPGLGVRCLGTITRDRLEAVRESDTILREEFAKNGLPHSVHP